MPMLIEHIDAIARRVGRDVLFISPSGLWLDDEYNDWENSTARQEITAWLEPHGITWLPCGEIANERCMRSPAGRIYIDLPYQPDDLLYQKMAAYFEDDGEGNVKWKGTRFCLLPLDVTMQNAHHDEPVFWGKMGGEILMATTPIHHSHAQQSQVLEDDTERAVFELITSYATTWRLLLEYDENQLTVPELVQQANAVLDYTYARKMIAVFQQQLMAHGEATPLFGLERSEALQGILASIEQTMFGDPLYSSREEKAAHLLYFVIKDHPFTDGNKRIGSFLFLLYLQQQAVPHTLTPPALTTLALLIAESAPANKDLMILLVMNLLITTVPHRG